MKTGISIILLFVSDLALSQQWHFANGPYEGEVHKLAIDRLRPSIIYAAVVGSEAGVYRGSSGGATSGNVSPPNTLGGNIDPVLIVDPKESKTIYYGGFSSGCAFLKTTDGGSSWKEKRIKERNVNQKIASLAIDPATPNVLYAGLKYASTNDAIGKSTDAGETWQNKSTGISIQSLFGAITSIELNPLNHLTLLADANNDGLFRSDDSADHWRYLGLKGDQFKDIRFVPWDTTNILVVTSSGLLKSTDGGASWYPAFSDYSTRCVEIDTTARILYVGTAGNGVFRSIDNGGTWVPINNPELPRSASMAMDVFDIALDPSESRNICLGTGVGPYRSTDGGTSWLQSFDGMKNFFALDVKVSPSNSSTIYAVGRSGIHKSTNGGQSWRYVGGGTAENFIAIDPRDPDIFYVSQAPIVTEYWLWRTTDGGKSWEKKLSSQTMFNFIEFDPVNSDMIYTQYTDFSYSGLCKSTNKGETWELLGLNVPSLLTSLAIAFDNSNLLYAGSGNGGAYRNTDQGCTWDSLKLATLGAQCFIHLDPRNSNIIIASIVDHGVFNSSDGGYEWKKLASDLDSTGLSRVILNSKASNEIFLKNSSGIFRSVNRGRDWSLFLHHPFGDTNYGIVLDTSGTGRFLIGGNKFPGIYTLDLITSVKGGEHTKSPRPIELRQNFPNPFNPSTTIGYELQQKSFVSLKVYDILGREIGTLVSKQQMAGKYSVRFDRADLPSGIYFYCLVAGAKVLVGKAVLVK